MTDQPLVGFRLEIPNKVLVATSQETSNRIEEVLTARLQAHEGSVLQAVRTLDNYTLTGKACTEAVTILQALARDHDVNAVLDTLEARDTGHTDTT